MQHWLVKEYAKLVGNHLQIWSGSFTGRGGGGGRGLLKLQLQVLKKRRVLRGAQDTTQSRKPPPTPMRVHMNPLWYQKKVFGPSLLRAPPYVDVAPPPPWGAWLPCCRVGLYPLAHEWFLHHDDMCYTTFV